MEPTDIIHADLSYTVTAARYAKGQLAIRPTRDGSGWKTLAALILADMPGVRWSGRERAYIVSPGRAKKFAMAIEEAREQRQERAARQQANGK